MTSIMPCLDNCLVFIEEKKGHLRSGVLLADRLFSSLKTRELTRRDVTEVVLLATVN